jgi:hypothetical protein
MVCDHTHQQSRIRCDAWAEETFRKVLATLQTASVPHAFLQLSSVSILPQRLNVGLGCLILDKDR